MNSFGYFRSFGKLIAGAVLVSIVAVACSSSGSTASPAATQAASQPPASQGGGGGGSGTVVAKVVGSNGTILVAGSNGMTVYTFESDTAGNGKSACTGGCATTWPPLTVTGAPTAGAGVTGTLGTITRDDGSTQVTYKGLPLYFFASDKAPGDTNGHYPKWNLVTP